MYMDYLSIMIKDKNSVFSTIFDKVINDISHLDDNLQLYYKKKYLNRLIEDDLGVFSNVFDKVIFLIDSLNNEKLEREFILKYIDRLINDESTFSFSNMRQKIVILFDKINNDNITFYLINNLNNDNLKKELINKPYYINKYVEKISDNLAIIIRNNYLIKDVVLSVLLDFLCPINNNYFIINIKKKIIFETMKKI